MAQKSITGVVTSDVRDKTITVSVTSRETHPIYKKQYSVTRTYTAHDEKNEAVVGDKVTIVGTRPISKTKSFTLAEVVEKGRGTVALKEDTDELVEKKAAAQKAAEAKDSEEKA